MIVPYNIYQAVLLNSADQIMPKSIVLKKAYLK
ncbi:hypothetical protein SAMN04488577_1924 [Bacillus sp. cl95]|nr:hypothetical protein SAMN02799634_103294 [Bacillus sp. UNCCL13]SFQ80696.1 hypothetical protein SAMN04488577_1924 [Bacillus sp. cl95]